MIDNATNRSSYSYYLAYPIASVTKLLWKKTGKELVTWIKFKFYYNFIINTHCWLLVNIYVIENDIVLVRHGLDLNL